MSQFDKTGEGNRYAEQCAAALEAVNTIPQLQSCLYDIGMLPEQLRRGSKEWDRMMQIAFHFRSAVSERRDTPSEAAIDAALAFLHKSRYLSHPDVREWRGTANGDTEEAWNRDYVAALLRAALAANHDTTKP